MEIITSIFVVFLTALLTNNIILNAGFGICSYVGVSNKRSSAIGMGFALVFVVFMASLVQLVEMIVKKFIPSLYNSLGIYLPLITTNCVVLFVTKQICDVPSLLENMGLSKGLVENNFLFEFIFAIVYALGSGFGYFVVIFLFSTIREKIDFAPVPKGFAGAGIAMVTTAILALAFSGLAGII